MQLCDKHSFIQLQLQLHDNVRSLPVAMYDLCPYFIHTLSAFESSWTDPITMLVSNWCSMRYTSVHFRVQLHWLCLRFTRVFVIVHVMSPPGLCHWMSPSHVVIDHSCFVFHPWLRLFLKPLVCPCLDAKYCVSVNLVPSCLFLVVVIWFWSSSQPCFLISLLA